MATAIAQPVKVTFDADTKIELGEEARTAIRREQIGTLHKALRRVEVAEEAMPELTSEAARDALAELGEALNAAIVAVDALYYLAPPRPEED